LAIQYNLHVDAGATYTRDIVYTNDDGSLFDLTGYSASMQIRPSVSSSTLTLAITPTLNTTTATVSFSLTAVQTAALAGSYVYAIELAKSPIVIRLMEGEVIVSPEVVR
jgi:hypothetical protein